VIIIALLLIITLANSLYTVAENEYAAVVRFSKIEYIKDTAGIALKVPFIDSVLRFPRTTLLYDVPESEVLTADKKNMTVDCYLIWEITDPQTFYQTLGTIAEAEARLDAITYNAFKNLMGTLQQSDIINEDDPEERNVIYEDIAVDVANIAKTYGIGVKDIKIKRFDLPSDNEQAVYARMISERTQIAEKYTADGELSAAVIRNEVDKTVNITISDAEAEAERIIAEGEAEYMRRLAEAYNTEDKKSFYEFMLALDALKASLNGSDKTVIIGADSPLGRLLRDK
jgi:membrane protease subunit HflC